MCTWHHAPPCVHTMPCAAGTEGEEALREEIASEHLSVLLSRRSDLFQDVGGAAAWARLRRALQNVQ